MAWHRLWALYCFKASTPSLVSEDFQEVNPTECLIVRGGGKGKREFEVIINKFRKRYYASVITKGAKGICVGRCRLRENWTTACYRGALQKKPMWERTCDRTQNRPLYSQMNKHRNIQLPKHLWLVFKPYSKHTESSYTYKKAIKNANTENLCSS